MGQETHDETIVEVLYECQNERCGHKQIIRYWKDETPLSAACCVKCRGRPLPRSVKYDFTVPNGVLKLTNEVTLGNFW